MEVNPVTTVSESSPVLRCLIEIPPNSFATTDEGCAPLDSNGNIVFFDELIIGGSPPFEFDWDDLGTPFNDDFYDDGAVGIDSLTAGTYAMIVTDANGCTAIDSVVIESIIIDVTTLIDSVGICPLTGGIQLVTYSGPPWYLNYNWDFAFTPFDDDYGTGPHDLGFPPEENDTEDVAEGLEGGIYFLTLTAVDDIMFPMNMCVFRDTFNISIDSVRIVCPSGDVSLFAGSFDTTITYQWQVDSLNGFENVIPDIQHSGTTTSILQITDMPTSWYGHQYRCRLVQGLDTTYSEPFTLKFGVCWDGISTDWHNASNWDCPVVPDTNTDAYIGTGESPYPVVIFNAFCRTLHLEPGASVTVFPPIKLNVTGGVP
jgi:hypothetical protein